MIVSSSRTKLKCMQLSWIVTGIERRLEKGSTGDAKLLGVEHLIGELYHWFDGENAHIDTHA